ncbi:class I SAM-dependent methyltransferase [Afipia massiliensis]|uniref:Class I SAM-dependent methyltransferase n=1 Tax=Afipia massiliensis TaxID=211460 RepID=A0A4U6BPT1_9BRAD|nr:class I SAM-dependent methyltransferase [Afipia massiliensis]TKT72412.1 class I SAM-dependent methyltransferase [Afipia massiliensis]
MSSSPPRLYWLGNAAKMTIIDEILRRFPGPQPVVIFDYGCGAGGDWPDILSAHPHFRLIGYEPHGPSAAEARRRLQGARAEVWMDDAVAILSFSADVIVSFSVFEHVIDRNGFLRHARRLMAPDGIFFLNYDDGHFRYRVDLGYPAGWLERIRSALRTIVSGPLAALGFPSRYQRRVLARDVDRLILQNGFKIERIDYSNIDDFKNLAKTIPEEKRQDFSRLWIETEHKLNEYFRVRLPSERFGDDTNLWQAMSSRTLVLRSAQLAPSATPETLGA